MLICAQCWTYTVPNTAKKLLCMDCWVLNNDDKPPCAWCYPGSKGNSYGSHGICQQHAEEQLAEVAGYIGTP